MKFLKALSVTAIGAALLFNACGDDGGTKPTPPPTSGYPAKLSDFEFFQGNMRDMIPNEGVVPYDVAATLWADGSWKGRFIVLPPGEKATFQSEEEWDFPEGTIIIKNFVLPLDMNDLDGPYRIVETRLLVREKGDWTSLTYVWDEAETEATRVRIGATVDYDITDRNGQPYSGVYVVPSETECRQCHGRSGSGTHLLGLVTGQVNRDIEIGGEKVNQIKWLEEQGIFSNSVGDVDAMHRLVDPLDLAQPLEDRARAYLHANCAHCHREDGAASRSGLLLTEWNTNDYTIGICKPPVAAGSGTGGRLHDIVPGSAEDSIMVFRMNSVDPAVKMPELSNQIVDDFGVGLVMDWINSMEPAYCSPTPGEGDEAPE